MCEWGTDVEVTNLFAGGSHPDFPEHRRTWKIDACIAPLVVALNQADLPTVASCCGHGSPGRISLKDGRELAVEVREGIFMIAGLSEAEHERLEAVLDEETE